MQFILGMTAVFGAVLFLGAACLMHGFKRGYQKGRFDADMAWLGLENAIEQERLYIREEKQREKLK